MGAASLMLVHRFRWWVLPTLAYVAAAVVIGLLKPEQWSFLVLLPLSLVATVATVRREIAGVQMSLERWVLLLLAGYLPLTNTWPDRVLRYLAHMDNQPVLWLLLPSVLVTVLLWWRSMRAGKHPLREAWRTMPLGWRIGGLLLLGGALLSSVFSAHPAIAWPLALLQFVAPVLLLSVVVVEARADRVYLRAIAYAVLGMATLPLALGAVAYLQQFGLPLSMMAVMNNKMALAVSGPYQDATFGNTTHMVDFLMWIWPGALVLSQAPATSRRGRTLMASVVILGVVNMVFIYSRFGLMTFLVVFLLLVVRHLFESPRFPWLIMALLVVLGLAVLQPTGMRYFQNLVRADTSAIGATGKGAHSTSDGSVQERLQAVRIGIAEFEMHWATGTGSGTYPFLDPVHTAPHNYLVQVGVENGALGLVGLALLYLSMIWAAVRRFIVRTEPLALAVWLGCASAALEAAVVGSNLILMGITVWAMLLGLLSGIGLTIEYDRSR